MKLLRLLPPVFFLSIAGCASDMPLPVEAHPQESLAARVHSRSTLRVLFIGNSYCFGAPRAFEKLANARGHKVIVDQQSFSGWTLAKHSKNPGTLSAMRNGHWDIVVIQEQSVIPSQPERQRVRAMTKPLRTLVSEARNAGAVPILYQSWGHRDGDPKVSGDSFPAMNQRLRDGYHAASRDAGGLVIVPVGDAWEKEVAAGHGASLYNPDGSHPTRDGNRLIAEVFYRTLFGS